MDEESDAPLTLNYVTQYPYAAIPVPWSAIFSGYPFNGSSEPSTPPIDATRLEAR